MKSMTESTYDNFQQFKRIYKIDCKTAAATTTPKKKKIFCIQKGFTRIETTFAYQCNWLSVSFYCPCVITLLPTCMKIRQKAEQLVKIYYFLQDLVVIFIRNYVCPLYSDAQQS